LNNSHSGNVLNDLPGSFHLATNFSNNNLAGLQHSLEMHDLHNISDELHRDGLHGHDEEEEDDDEEDEDDGDDDDSHLHKIKHSKGSRKKK